MNQTLARRAWDRWQAAAGPWQGWTICPALLSPEIETLALPLLDHHESTSSAPIARLLEPGATLCLLDLEPELGVELAAGLAHLAHPVLVLPRWPYAEAVLPVDRLLATLVDASRRLPRHPQRHDNVVFVLDNQRAQPVPARSSTDPRADNRYHLATFDLPDLRTLRQRGIRHIQHISRRVA